ARLRRGGSTGAPRYDRQYVNGNVPRFSRVFPLLPHGPATNLDPQSRRSWQSSAMRRLASLLVHYGFDGQVPARLVRRQDARRGHQPSLATAQAHLDAWRAACQGVRSSAINGWLAQQGLRLEGLTWTVL